MGHKSPSSTRYFIRLESREILQTRRAVRAAMREGTQTHTGTGEESHRPTAHESSGHRHYRLLHKNLAPPPINRTGRVRRVKVEKGG